jgi:aryl-alcohol dehydrogenase-like predicted oxidoreductase
MEFKTLGATGLKVSELCLGTMQFGWTADEETSHEVLSAAFEAGINFIDTADIYSRWVPGNPGGVAEKLIGDWMKKSNIPRHKLIIATKVRGVMGDGPNDEGLSRLHILRAVDKSLERLGTDYIDLYQTHWYDENTPIEETLSALDDLVHQGKVRYIGCSNYPTWRLIQALWVADKSNLTRFDSLQPHYSLVHRAEFERELADTCQYYNIGVIPYSPLAGGFLTGKYRKDSAEVDSQRAEGVQRYFSPANWELLDTMDKMAEGKGGKSVSQIALAWLLADPIITSPIIGPRTIEQLQDNLGAVDVKLNGGERELLGRASNWREKPS